jgi:hypothetical protein
MEKNVVLDRRKFLAAAGVAMAGSVSGGMVSGNADQPDAARQEATIKSA